MLAYISHIVFFCIAPSHICLFLLAAGCVFQFIGHKQRLAKWLVVASFSGFVVLGFSPIGNLLILPLEERFNKVTTLPKEASVAGIIMLGGFEESTVSNARDTLAMSGRCERLTETVLLSRKLPNVPIIFSGGEGGILFSSEPAGNAVRKYLTEVGVPKDKIIIETNSVNTWQYAIYTAKLVRLQPGKRYILVTSAWHMPRAVGAFRQAGFDVIPWPVDYHTAGTTDLWQPLSFLTHGLYTVDIATKQWIGLLWYWLTGRSDALYPG